MPTVQTSKLNQLTQQEIILRMAHLINKMDIRMLTKIEAWPPKHGQMARLRPLLFKIMSLCRQYRLKKIQIKTIISIREEHKSHQWLLRITDHLLQTLPPTQLAESLELIQ